MGCRFRSSSQAEQVTIGWPRRLRLVGHVRNKMASAEPVRVWCGRRSRSHRRIDLVNCWSPGGVQSTCPPPGSVVSYFRWFSHLPTGPCREASTSIPSGRSKSGPGPPTYPREVPHPRDAFSNLSVGSARLSGHAPRSRLPTRLSFLIPSIEAVLLARVFVPLMSMRHACSAVLSSRLYLAYFLTSMTLLRPPARGPGSSSVPLDPVRTRREQAVFALVWHHSKGGQ